MTRIYRAWRSCDTFCEQLAAYILGHSALLYLDVTTMILFSLWANRCRTSRRRQIHIYEVGEVAKCHLL